MPENSQPEIITPPAAVPPQQFGFFERYRKPLWATLIILAVVTAALLTYVLFFRNSGQAPSYQGEVKLAINAPAESASGSELSYQILIDNQTNTKLTGLSLEVFYPQNFSFLNSTPKSQDPNARTFTFADLPPGQQQRLVIVGRLEGGVQEIKTLNAKLHYVPESFRSSLVADATTSTVILAPDLSFRLQAQPHLVTGQTMTYEIEVSNIAARAFSDITVSLAFPDRFEYKGQASPLPAQTTDKNVTWTLDKLDIGEARTITLTGKLLEDPGKESFAQADLFLKDSSGQPVSAGRSFAFTQILPSPLVLTQQLTTRVDAILPGQTLEYQVNYENIGEVGLSNVVISVSFDTPVFDFSKLTSTTGQLRANQPAAAGQSLVWFPGNARELLVVGPHQKGSFTFSIPVSDKLVAALQKNPKATTRVRYSSKEITEPITGNSLDFPIQTQLAVTSALQVLSGANPPIPDQPTVYQIELDIANGVNDVRDAELIATIPRTDVVLPEDSISPAEERGSVQYVPTSGILRWKVGQIFALSGSYHDSRKLIFNLVVTPTTANPTGSLPLLKDIQVSGTDDFTGKNILSNKIERLTLSGSLYQ